MALRFTSGGVRSRLLLRTCRPKSICGPLVRRAAQRSIRWAGFAKASNNGWASMAISPANEKTAGWLMHAVKLLIDGGTTTLLPADRSWRN